jgi:cholesterol transport system auxiliary component
MTTWSKPSRGARGSCFLPRWTSVAGLLPVLLMAGQSLGCALTGKAEMLDTRYFEPEPQPVGIPAKGGGTSAGAPMELQLGRVTASAYLKSRMVYRASSLELGAYEDRQWTERPEEYLRRAMLSSLFDARGITHALSGDGPTLDLELGAFEEIRNGTKSVGRVTIRYVLRDEHSVWQAESITVDRATAGGGQKPEQVVAAISEALASASVAVADKVGARLKAPPAPPSS